MSKVELRTVRVNICTIYMHYRYNLFLTFQFLHYRCTLSIIYDDMSPLQLYLKDSFNQGEVDGERWGLIQGGEVSVGCDVLVDGSGLTFTGKGQRQAVTQDLDLRNARYIIYLSFPDSSV